MEALQPPRECCFRETWGKEKVLMHYFEANCPELTVEAIILQPKFRSLFSISELKVAQERLGEYGKLISAHLATRERLFPDELPPGYKYIEGAKKQIRVNAYERDPKARKACLAYHGYDCSVCGFNFETHYGELGINFIHVHHLHQLSLTDGAYVLDPIADLRPVCPNCHAMLHREELSLTIEQLRKHLGQFGG